MQARLSLPHDWKQLELCGDSNPPLTELLKQADRLYLRRRPTEGVLRLKLVSPSWRLFETFPALLGQKICWAGHQLDVVATNGKIDWQVTGSQSDGQPSFQTKRKSYATIIMWICAWIIYFIGMPVRLAYVTFSDEATSGSKPRKAPEFDDLTSLCLGFSHRTTKVTNRCANCFISILLWSRNNRQ